MIKKVDRCKKRLKIPKRISESVHRRRIYNTMTNKDLHNIHIKLKIELHDPH
jgi:hypothetical protein